MFEISEVQNLASMNPHTYVKKEYLDIASTINKEYLDIFINIYSLFHALYENA
jgi:hypothetical protein